MFDKRDVTLWTDELVFGQAAIDSQLEEYCKSWRETFIKYDAHIAQVYLPAIAALKETSRKFKEAIDSLRESR